ncbi:MAG TPA: GAF domain-containing sensor histidine kinase [Coleofasciculaceae cyanobacterium]
MDAKSAIAAPMLNPLTSRLSGTSESVVTQEPKGLIMHPPTPSAQIGQQITQIILTSPDPQTLLVKTAEAVGRIAQVDFCLLVADVHSSETNQMALWCADNSSLLPEQQVQHLKHRTLSEDFSNPEPLAIQDIQVGTDWPSEGRLVRSILRVYTRFQSGVNGAIILGRSQPHGWTSWEKQQLVLASDSVAIAISQVQLTRQVQAASRYQTLLNQFTPVSRSDLDLMEVLQMALTSTAQALQVDRGLVLLLKSTERPFTPPCSQHLLDIQVTVAYEWRNTTSNLAVSSAANPSTLLDQSFWLSESQLCQQAFRNAPEPTAITDRSSRVTLPTETLSYLEQNLKPSVLLVPLVELNSNAPLTTPIVGFLVLEHDQPHSWLANELELVKWVSTQVSATLSQNQTLRHIQSMVDDRTAQLQRSLEVQAKLYEKTRQQIDQLQPLNQLKEEFLSSMSHELRTPLTTMSLAIRMLRHQPKLSPERREQYLEILEQQCNREIELIQDLLDLQRLEADRSQIQPQKIDLMRLIKELAASFEEKWAGKRLTLKIESPVRSLMLNTDPDSLHRILTELLTNAGKYSDSDTTVVLRITNQIQQSANQVVLTLSNTGVGISPQDLIHVFDKFRRGSRAIQDAVQGTGLGLALVKCLVQHLNGTIEAKSEPLDNSPSSLTSFTVTLPQLQPYQTLEP